MSSDTLGAVRRIVMAQLELDANQIQLDSDLREDLGLDSLHALEMVFDVEEEFGIELPEEVALGLKTVRDVCDAIAERVTTDESGVDEPG